MKKKLISLLIILSFLIESIGFNSFSFELKSPKDTLRPLSAKLSQIQPNSIIDIPASKFPAPEAKSFKLDDIFRRILMETGLSNDADINIAIDDFPEEEMRNPACKHLSDNDWLIHPEFVLHVVDITNSNLEFYYTFKNGSRKRIKPAYSLAHRAVMRERGLTEEDNTIVDDAVWLWYLYSYKGSNGVIFDENKFKQRIIELFEGNYARIAKAEFPSLVQDATKREEAIKLALEINKQFLKNKNHVIYYSEEPDTKPVLVDPESKYQVYTELPKNEEMNKKTLHAIFNSEQQLDEEDSKKEAERFNAIQGHILEIVLSLKKIKDNYKQAETDKEKDDIKNSAERLPKTPFVNLYKNIPVHIYVKEGIDISDEEEDYDFYSRALKVLKKKQRKISRKIRQVYNEGDEIALQRCNLESIKIEILMLKLGAKIADMLIHRRSKHKSWPWIINTTLSTLEGISNSAERLEEEFIHRIKHLYRVNNEDIEIFAFMPSRERLKNRIFRLGQLGVQIIGESLTQKSIEFKIKQRISIDIPKTLNNIIECIRRGKISKAKQKLQMLIGIYGIDRIKTTEHDNIQAALEKLYREEIENLDDGYVPMKKTIDSISEKIGWISLKINYTIQTIWQEIDNSSLSDFQIGQIKKFAQYEPTIALMYQDIANLKTYAKRLIRAERLSFRPNAQKTANKKGFLRKDREWIPLNLERIITWTKEVRKKGFDYPKQQFDSNLRKALDCISRDEFRNAAECINDAVSQLENKLSKIDKKTTHVKERATAIFLAYRDKDINNTIDGAILKALEEGDFKEAIAQINEIKGKYFSNNLIEPGYKRAEELLKVIEFMMQAAQELDKPEATIARIKEKLSLLKNDIYYKHSFRIHIILNDGRSKIIYIRPGTTVKDFLDNLHIYYSKRNGLKEKRSFLSICMYFIRHPYSKDKKLSDLTTIGYEATNIIEELKSRKWSKEQEDKIPNVIQALYKLGYPINARAMQHYTDPSAERSKVISEILERKGATSKQLYAKVRRLGKQWYPYLKEIGLPADALEGGNKDTSVWLRLTSKGAMIKYASQIEMQVAVILSVFKLINEVKRGLNFQVSFRKTTDETGSADFMLQYKTKTTDKTIPIVIEVHDVPWAGETNEEYASRRAEELKGDKLTRKAKLIVVQNPWDIVEELKNLGIDIEITDGIKKEFENIIEKSKQQTELMRGKGYECIIRMLKKASLPITAEKAEYKTDKADIANFKMPEEKKERALSKKETGARENILSKSRFIEGCTKCDGYIWRKVNDPKSIPEPDAVTQFRFDQGHLVTELAKKLFPDGIDISTDDFWGNIEKARELLTQRKTLFEPGILAGPIASEEGYVYSRMDILDILTPLPDGTWEINEVKSSTKPKDVNILDVAFQRYCCERLGKELGSDIKISKCFLILINNEYVKEGEIEPTKLFKKIDITEEVDKAMEGIEERIKKIRAAISAEEPLPVSIGKHCKDPYDCPLKGECWNPAPDIFQLYYHKGKFELYEQGIHTFDDILKNRDSIKLSDRQEIQLWCEEHKKPHINKTAIRNFIEEKLGKPPWYFLDFETFSTAVPIFDGTWPYQQVPFQFSVHKVDKNFNVTHHSFLADGSEDPRAKLLVSLKEALGSEGSIVVYYESFEKSRLEELAKAFPEYKEWVENTLDRVVDLLVPFKKFYYYHPGQKGSASLKAVAPVLTEEGKQYKEMGINNGQDATLAFLEIISNKLSEERVTETRGMLEKYCGLDTEVMIFMIYRLMELTGIKYIKEEDKYVVEEVVEEADMIHKRKIKSDDTIDVRIEQENETSNAINIAA